MQIKNKDMQQQLTQLKKIYKSYFSAIRARSSEGRVYMQRAFLAALVYEGLNVERFECGPNNYDYLIFNHEYILDVVRVEHLTGAIASACRSQLLSDKFDLLVFNFGSSKPECYFQINQFRKMKFQME